MIGPVSRLAAGVEALVLQRRGARVTTVNPDERTLSVMGSNLMDPGPRDAVIAAGLAQGRRLAVTPTVRSSSSPDRFPARTSVTR